jgi:putative Holliday junction resolvase
MVPDPMTQWEFSAGQDPFQGVSLSLGEGVLLGVDWGDRRVGFALSDRSRRFAWPIDPFIRKVPGKFSHVKDLSLVESIRKLIAEEEIVGMVFGVPYYHLSGDSNPKAQDFLESGRKLSSAISLPILFWDEGLSSDTVRSNPFTHQGKKKGRSFSKDPWIDSRSASLVLESFLTSCALWSKNRMNEVFSNKVGVEPNEP